MGNFVKEDQWENQNKMVERHPEGHIKDPRNKRLEQTIRNTEKNGGVF